jgi:hypothetical protein
MAIKTRNAQVVHLKDLAWILCWLFLGALQAAQIYGATGHYMGQILWKYGKNPDAHFGRPFIPTPDQKKCVIDEIEKRREDEMYFTQADMVRCVSTTMQIPVSQGWVFWFLKRYADQICVEAADPQEEPRLQVPVYG